jgi:hypothetical protein
MKRYVFAIICGIARFMLAAQDTDNLSVEVVRAYDPSLPSAEKVNRVPVFTIDSVEDTTKVLYLLKTIRPLTHGYPLNPIPAAKVQHEPAGSTENVQGYVKAGIGYSLSTLLDAEVGGSPSSSFAWDIYAKHYGYYGDIINSKDEKVPTLNMDNDIGLALHKSFNNNFVAFNGGFAPKFAKYYGYDADNYSLEEYKNLNKDSTDAQFLKTYVDLIFSGSKNTWNYSANVSFHDFRANQDRNEDAVQTKIMAEKNIDSAFSIGAAAHGNIYMQSAAVSAQNHTHFAIIPHGRYKRRWIDAAIHLNITIDKHNSMKTYFLPSANFTALLFDYAFCPYFEVNSTLAPYYFANAISENPYINPFDTINLKETLKYNFILGIKGKYRTTFDYKIWADYTILNDEHFFYNTMDAVGNYFNIIYDNGGRFSVNLNANLRVLHGFELGINYIFQTYYLDSLSVTLHKPQHVFTAMAKYNFSSNFVLSAMVNVRSCYYFLSKNMEYEQNNTGIDISLSAEYAFSKYCGVFLHLNNILSQNYEIYNGYNQYGFIGIVGFLVKF